MKCVISAVSRKITTLADGSMRIMVEVSATDALAAFELFGQPATPMALAALTQDASIASAQASTIASDKPKGGALSKWAAMRCAESDFQKFIRPIYDKLMGGDGSRYGDVTPENDFNGDCALWARHCILVICDIESRAELDTNEIAKSKFNGIIREPYIEWIKMQHENEVQPF